LLTFIIDNDASLPKDFLFNSYYDLYVDEDVAERIRRQAGKLLPLLDSPKAWKESSYGGVLKFLDAATIADVRRICADIADVGNADSPDTYYRKLQKNIEVAKSFQKSQVREGIVMTALRSAAPLAMSAVKDLPQTYTQFWRTGRTTPIAGSKDYPNPAIAPLTSQFSILHYGTDPVLGFHLAPAYANLTDNSPLKPDDKGDGSKAVLAAKLEFHEWAKALRKLLNGKLKLRFVVSDMYAFCHSLQHVAAGGGVNSHWFRRQWDVKPFKFDSTAQSNEEISFEFDAIDSSNLSDHFGMLNILVATIPLLKRRPWATITTELLLKTENDQKKRLDQLLGGNVTTISMLLGVAPLHFWTNAKMESHVDEIILGLLNKTSNGEQQLHSRIAWKLDDQVSHQPKGRGKLHVDPSAMTRIIREVYLWMFRHESINSDMGRLLSRTAAYSHFHRGSFVAFFKFVRRRIATDWSATTRDFITGIDDDDNLSFSKRQRQDLIAQLHMSGVFSDPWILSQAESAPAIGQLKGWVQVPAIVAITLVVPRNAIDRLYSDTIQHRLAAPTLQGFISTSADALQNMYSDVHIVFGQVDVSKITDGCEGRLDIQPDELGWLGSLPLIVSFYVPTAALVTEPTKIIVGLNVVAQSQSAALYFPILGPSMCVYETKLDNKEAVHFSRYLPGQSDYPSCSSPVHILEDVTTDEAEEITTKLSAEVPSESSRISQLIGRVDINSEEGKGMLKAKAPIELYQRDPFLIQVRFEKKPIVYTIRFPVPVSKSECRTRIARTTGYIEVIAPMVDVGGNKSLEEFIFPNALTVTGLPVALTMSHMTLDRLPILDLSKRNELQWLTTLTSFQFSPREKLIRDGRNPSGMAADLRVNFKESLFTIFMLASGLQGGQTGLFGINHPERGGIHMLILVSAFRLDADTGSIVLDAAVLPLTLTLLKELEPFLLVLESLQCAHVHVNDAELDTWKKMLPSFAERCRTWSHGPKCEYKRNGATIPLSLKDGEPFMCSCGSGKLPKNFLNLPEWEIASAQSTRIAISPFYAVPYVEEVADTSTFGATGTGTGTKKLTCRACGRDKASDGGELKKCMRCSNVRYCSRECQRKDWKTHRMECEN
jgi:hypothetical protein